MFDEEVLSSNLVVVVYIRDRNWSCGAIIGTSNLGSEKPPPISRFVSIHSLTHVNERPSTLDILSSPSSSLFPSGSLKVLILG